MLNRIWNFLVFNVFYRFDNKSKPVDEARLVARFTTRNGYDKAILTYRDGKLVEWYHTNNELLQSKTTLDKPNVIVVDLPRNVSLRCLLFRSWDKAIDSYFKR